MMEQAVVSALPLLREGQAACVVLRDSEIIRAETGRGVAPMIRLYEDGALQGLLELCGIPYVGPDICASAMISSLVRSLISISATARSRPTYVDTISLRASSMSCQYNWSLQSPTLPKER